jgi:hypothetical protein
MGVLCALLLGGGIAAQGTSAISSPAPGTATRRAVLDALRRRLGSAVTFKVAHLAVTTGKTGNIAFVRAGEIVRDGDAWQETDLFVEALLERSASTRRWRAVAMWNLAESPDRDAHQAFVAKVHAELRARDVPVAVLPHDLRTVP